MFYASSIGNATRLDRDVSSTCNSPVDMWVTMKHKQRCMYKKQKRWI